MASVNYGELNMVIANNKKKLVANISPKTRINITKFPQNNAIYMHITSRGNNCSLSYEEFEELVNLKMEMDKKIPLLNQVRHYILNLFLNI